MVQDDIPEKSKKAEKEEVTNGASSEDKNHNEKKTVEDDLKTTVQKRYQETVDKTELRWFNYNLSCTECKGFNGDKIICLHCFHEMRCRENLCR